MPDVDPVIHEVSVWPYAKDLAGFARVPNTVSHTGRNFAVAVGSRNMGCAAGAGAQHAVGFGYPAGYQVTVTAADTRRRGVHDSYATDGNRRATLADADA